MNKAQFSRYFKENIETEIQSSDKPALREAWNNTIDSMIKNGELKENAGNWSHPARFYNRGERMERKVYSRKTKDVFVLRWNGEDIDEAETKKDCLYLVKEYNLAYNGGVSYKRKRVSI
jgi:tRNA pseudouridine-54 N-methylase